MWPGLGEVFISQSFESLCDWHFSPYLCRYYIYIYRWPFLLGYQLFLLGILSLLFRQFIGCCFRHNDIYFFCTRNTAWYSLRMCRYCKLCSYWWPFLDLFRWSRSICIFFVGLGRGIETSKALDVSFYFILCFFYISGFVEGFWVIMGCCRCSSGRTLEYHISEIYVCIILFQRRCSTWSLMFISSIFSSFY